LVEGIDCILKATGLHRLSSEFKPICGIHGSDQLFGIMLALIRLVHSSSLRQLDIDVNWLVKQDDDS
jgi:hypothetical protein